MSSGNKVVQGQLGPKAGKVEIDSLVAAAARRHGVNPALIHAVIRQESNYDWYAVSHKGACGLMQLMPLTARRFGVRNIFDPAENVEGGVKYLRHLLDRYSGDAALTLAAYNAGEGAVERFGGIPPYRETQDYVGRVSRFTGSFHSSVSDSLAEEALEASSQPRVIARVTDSGVIRFEME
jgi:soluble lytic murein transglycosylase-like protein